MADDHSRDELALLRARVEQLETKRRPRPRRRLPRRFLPLALVALLIALVPLATVAADFAFLDLNSGSPHNDNIAAIKAAGITKGCNPPNYTQYCPNGLVTREEMASFLARTAGLGGNPPVVNAKTAQTADTATNATHATNATNAANATNANTIGGLAPNALTRIAFAAKGTDTTIPVGGTVAALTVTLTVPTQSYVLVTYTGLAFASSTANCPCAISGRLAQDGATPILDVVVNVATTATDLVDGYDRRQIAGSQVFLATPGTHTYTFSVARFSGSSTNIGIGPARLQAQLIPFASTGGGATEITPPSEVGSGSSGSTAP